MKMKMKKIISLALIIVLTGLAGCGSPDNFPPSSQEGIVSPLESTGDSAPPASGSPLFTAPDKSSSESASQPSSKAPEDVQTRPDAQNGFTSEPAANDNKPSAEPESRKSDAKKEYTCTFSIECSTVLNHTKDLKKDKLDIIPSNGIIFAPQTVTFYEGESVYDVLRRVCRENKIQLESSWTPMYNSAYIEGIHNLYEFDCGSGSNWMYCVNGWYPNYGCSRYQLKQGEIVEWRYTCDLGRDIGDNYWKGGTQ